MFGLILIAAAARLIWHPSDDEQETPPPIWLAFVIGAAIGILSGLVGVGGGIFLSPISLLFNWSSAKTAAGVSALFILVNSAAGLAGNCEQIALLPTSIILWIAAAALGGLVGSTLGARWLASIWLRRLLAVVLLVAGAKLLFA